MKNDDPDRDLSNLLNRWETPAMDLSNVEHNVRRRIVLQRLKPTLRSWLMDLGQAWRQAFSLRPLLGTVVTCMAILLGSAGGFAIGAPAADRISDRAIAAYATEINPILQARNPQ